MIENPTEEQLKNSLCHRCHWKDDNMCCHAVEPPKIIDVAIEEPGDCAFIAVSYWNRIPQEYKDNFNNEVIKRSERYYKSTSI